MKNIFKPNTLFKKIVLWFGIALLLFGSITSVVFSVIYVHRIYDTYLIDIAKAVSISVSSHIENNNSTLGSKNPAEIKTYTNIISGVSNISDVDVWVITQNRDLMSLNKATGRLEFDQVPTRYTEMLDTMFAGNDVHNISYKKVWNRNMFGVGTPIFDSGGFIIGVVLVQASFDVIATAMKSALTTLISSSLIALAVTFLISVFVSRVLTRPLEKIKITCLALQEHRYYARTEVSQSDEMGELALVIDELASRLETAKKASDNLETMRQDFISGISHELRTPVTVMRVSLEALCDGVVTDPEKVDQYHTAMLKDSIQLQRLVNDLLDISKLQTPEFQMNMNLCNPIEVIKDSLWAIQPLSIKKGIVLEFEPASYLEEKKVFVDYGRIVQLFTIFLHNSVKFTPENKKIRICAEYENIKQFTSSETTECLVCSISDQGCGIPADELDRIFERFYRCKAAAEKDGSGLGLAIAYQIAKRHNIEIKSESLVGAGTKFTLTFPPLSNHIDL